MKLFIIFAAFISIGYSQKHKLCVYPRDNERYTELERGGSLVQPIKVEDSVDCALKLSKGEADFGSFDPEQVHVISSFITTDHAVIAEARGKDFETRNNSFQMVVVVRSDYNGGLNNLKGKKYCHPGFQYHELWTPRARKEFENILFQDKLKQDCLVDSSVTYMEKELQVISEFFGDSCRPGPWSYDSELEKKLKRKYSNLCKLCDDPASCEYSNSDENNSLTCLTQKNGDIAYTTLNAAYKLANRQNYKLLCRNGELTEISNNLPADCSWRNQPWTLIIGRKDKTKEIQTNLINWIDAKYIAVTQGASPFAVKNRPLWQNTLAQILTQVEAYRLNILTDISSINTFLGKNGQAMKIDVNDCPMRWCTISQEEQNKCEWVAKASLYAGITPQISCVTGTSIYSCLKQIYENNADIIAIDSNFGYLARRAKINNVLYSENSDSDVASIVAVVPPDSAISKFEDIKGKRACFPEYRGLAWVSFIENARKRKLIPNNCKFGKSVSEFFDALCAPGAKDQQHYRSGAEDYPKLCSICSDNCESDRNNPLYDNHGALSCLRNRLADVAFVEFEALANNITLKDYKVICNDGTTMQLNHVGSNENCPLSRTVDSEVIARHNDTRKSDYKQALLMMDRFFGTSQINQRTIAIFKSFNGIENLMFKSNVLGFDDDSSDNQYVKNYVELFKKIDECTSGTWMMSASNLIIFISSLLLLLVRN